MRRFTDKPLTIMVDGFDLSTVTNIHVTMRQPGIVVDITDVTVLENTICVHLTQEQTGKFSANHPLKIMVNYYVNNERGAFDEFEIEVKDNLLDKVLHYE